MNGTKGERRRRELLDIAYRLFIQKGYEKTSIDDIIARANIAKGTYYYYFPSKEATLEAVIDMLINYAAERARTLISEPIPVTQKAAAVIKLLRPGRDESGIVAALNKEENILMHEKINRRMIEMAVPILAEIVKEGIAQGVFCCDDIEERVKMLLIMSRYLFDDGSHTEKDIEVYIDMVEKTLGAGKGTMDFIREVI